jgi:signal transduction histidine kinase
MHPVFHKTILIALVLFLVLVFFSYLMIRRLLKEIAEKDLESLKAIIDAQEKERAAIAQEIHDNLAPTLSIAQMQISFLTENQGKDHNETLLPKIQKQLQDAVILCREVSHALSPDLTSETDIHQVLDHYISKINQTGKLKIVFENSSELGKIDTAAGTSIIRIVQELIANTLKHAHATQVRLVVLYDNGDLILSYTDDGKGLPQKNFYTGMGMRNIEKRIQILKGKISWRNNSSAPGMNAIIKIPFKFLNNRS